MDVDILGVKYTVTITNDGTDHRLKDCDGICDETTCEILASDYAKHRGDKACKRRLDIQTQKVVRHEIIHAFLCESGLAENSEWAQTEEMVDWFAKQGPKIYKAWQAVNAL